jgi:hypothetical protein
MGGLLIRSDLEAGGRGEVMRRREPLGWVCWRGREGRGEGARVLKRERMSESRDEDRDRGRKNKRMWER